MKKVNLLTIVLFSAMILSTGCVGREENEDKALSNEETANAPTAGEIHSGPFLKINHVGQSRSKIYQMDAEISGEVPLTFGKEKVIEGIGHGTYESSSISLEISSISSHIIQDVVFTIRGKMTDDCKIEIAITEDRLSGIKTSGYSYINFPRRGRPGEMNVESYEAIPGSEFNEGKFTIPFKSTLYKVITTKENYDWTWTFQLFGVDEHEEMHGCIFTGE